MPKPIPANTLTESWHPTASLILAIMLMLFLSGQMAIPSLQAAGPTEATSIDDARHQTPTPVADPMAYNLDARATLGVTTTLVEQYLKHALTSLRLIAATPATRSGIWPEIRPALVTLADAIPGAALYIEPDGNYYSVDRGYTGLNLADRNYFRDLFAGEEVLGELIYSRSTGKQSVIMAVPVMEDNQVTGAVALSIFLDDFQEVITESLNLPTNFLWYVVDEEANTVLHPRSDFVFMNPLDQGSPSLRLAVEEVITKEEGYTNYVFAGRNTHILFKKLDFNDWRVVLGKIGEQVEDVHMPAAYDILDSMKESIGEQMRSMKRNLDEMVRSFEGSFPPDHVARLAFRQFYEDNPFVISCALVDAEGVMVCVEPADFRPSEGEMLFDEENFYTMQSRKLPLLSSSFIAQDGFDAVNLLNPILDDQGVLIGAVSMILRPDVMVEELVTPYIMETIYDPWIMEPDGRIIFDKAIGGTGRMLFTDYRASEQQTLLELGNLISEKAAGQGDYIHIDQYSGERTVKMAIWNTMELYDARWRIILSYPPYD